MTNLMTIFASYHFVLVCLIRVYGDVNDVGLIQQH